MILLSYFIIHSEADIASRLGRMNPVPRIGGSSSPAGGDRRHNNQSSNNNNKPAQPKRQPKTQPHIKTAEELDAEMDTYMGEVKMISRDLIFTYRLSVSAVHELTIFTTFNLRALHS